MKPSPSDPTPPQAPAKPSAPAAPTDGPARSTMVFPEAAAGADALPRVTTAAELGAQDGNEVQLVGTYVERDVRMKQTPPPVHRGHVAIELADGKLVALLPAWDDDAPRPAAEIAKFVGQKVVVVGLVSKRGAADPSGGASMIGPTIDEIQALRLAP